MEYGAFEWKYNDFCRQVVFIFPIHFIVSEKDTGDILG